MLLITRIKQAGADQVEISRSSRPQQFLDAYFIAEQAAVVLLARNRAEIFIHSLFRLKVGRFGKKQGKTHAGGHFFRSFPAAQILLPGVDVGVIKKPRHIQPFIPQTLNARDGAWPAAYMQENFFHINA